MSNLDIVRAWKDPEYRSTLNSAPAHPAGQIELADAGLNAAIDRTKHRHSKIFCFNTHQEKACG